MAVKNNKNKTVKKVTIENLAQMVAKGFGGIEKRVATKDDLKDLEKRMDEKFEGIKGQIGGINRRIDDISLNKVKYTDHDALKRRVEALEKV